LTDWGELYSHIIACTGWTWEYIAENIDLPRLESMNRYWRKSPPLHLMVQAYLGITPTEDTFPPSIEEQQYVPATKLTKDEFDALLKAKGLIT